MSDDDDSIVFTASQGQRWLMRDCDTCGQQMTLIEDYMEKQTTCKSCRNETRETS